MRTAESEGIPIGIACKWWQTLQFLAKAMNADYNGVNSGN
jgi:hypothetical protein